MKALKFLVIGMAVAIVAMIALVGYALVGKFSHGEVKGGLTTASSAAPEAASAVPYQAELPVPPGLRLVQSEPVAGGLALRFAGDKVDWLAVIDPRNGRLIGSVTIVPQAAASAPPATTTAAPATPAAPPAAPVPSTTP